MGNVPAGIGQQIALGGRIISGQKTVTAAGTAEQITSTATRLVSGVFIKALAGNTGDVYVGDPDVDSSGYFLDAGEEVFLRINDLSLVWLDVGTSADGVKYLAS